MYELSLYAIYLRSTGKYFIVDYSGIRYMEYVRVLGARDEAERIHIFEGHSCFHFLDVYGLL